MKNKTKAEICWKLRDLTHYPQFHSLAGTRTEWYLTRYFLSKSYIKKHGILHAFMASTKSIKSNLFKTLKFLYKTWPYYLGLTCQGDGWRRKSRPCLYLHPLFFIWPHLWQTNLCSWLEDKSNFYKEKEETF